MPVCVEVQVLTNGCSVVVDRGHAASSDLSAFTPTARTDAAESTRRASDPGTPSVARADSRARIARGGSPLLGCSVFGQRGGGPLGAERPPARRPSTFVAGLEPNLGWPRRRRAGRESRGAARGSPRARRRGHGVVEPVRAEPLPPSHAPRTADVLTAWPVGAVEVGDRPRRPVDRAAAGRAGTDGGPWSAIRCAA